jgi:hypothetical protein
MSLPLLALGTSYLDGYLQNYLVNKSSPQTARNQFQQLGQDLQAGNLTQARRDYNVLAQNLSGHRINGSLSQDFSVLGGALHSGNLSAARQAYSVIQEALQQLGLNLAGSNGGQPTGSTVNATA